MSRDICVHLYNEIVKLRPDWHDADPEQGAIKIVMTGSASDKALLRPHIYSAQVKKRLEKRFKDPADPLRLVIVRDMWLTGFDAPCVHTLYVDKPMKGHNLMQAIARVNRVFKDKQGGLVVDYIGIANELKSALKEYTASKGRGPAHRGRARGLQRAGREAGCAARHAARLRLQRLPDRRPQDAGRRRQPSCWASRTARSASPTLALAMSKAFTLCCTLDEAKAVREEVAFFQAVKVILTKREISQQKKTDEAARAGDPPDHQLGRGVGRGGRHLRRRGPGQAQHRHPRRRLPGRGAQPARAQPGGGAAGAAARRRDQVTLRRQRGAEQEVLRHADRRGAALPEPVHRSRAGDGRAGADGQEVPRGGGARRSSSA